MTDSGSKAPVEAAPKVPKIPVVTEADVRKIRGITEEDVREAMEYPGAAARGRRSAGGREDVRAAGRVRAGFPPAPSVGSGSRRARR